MSVSEVYQWITFTIVGMILGEDGDSFSVPPSSYEPARTFRYEPDENDLQERRTCLENGWNSDVRGTE